MALTIQQQSAKRRTPGNAHREGFIHFLARECQWILRGLVIASAAATILLMFTIFYWAILPAMILLASYCLLLIADYIEYRTHRPGDPGWELQAIGRAAAAETVTAEVTAQAEATEHVRDAVKARLTKTIIGILASVAIVAVIVAGIFLHRELLAIGGMILFAYWLFIAAPLWLGWLEDEAEAEAHRAEEELHENA